MYNTATMRRRRHETGCDQAYPIRLDNETASRLTRVAAILGVNKADVVRFGIAQTAKELPLLASSFASGRAKQLLIEAVKHHAPGVKRMHRREFKESQYVDLTDAEIQQTVATVTVRRADIERSFRRSPVLVAPGRGKFREFKHDISGAPFDHAAVAPNLDFFEAAVRVQTGSEADVRKFRAMLIERIEEEIYAWRVKLLALPRLRATAEPLCSKRELAAAKDGPGALLNIIQDARQSSGRAREWVTLHAGVGVSDLLPFVPAELQHQLAKSVSAPQAQRDRGSGTAARRKDSAHAIPFRKRSRRLQRGKR